ncbi:MAG: 2,3-bisphosphoglycerate-dependent phosphoglycerate mutase, partial [Muribaculaceae bacterium]|nr:2,3-bisphosphoglycerate-dependent phosphoglycerate mutase [Muribaculaceae bacterium]
PDDPANPRFDPRYAAVPSAWLPLTESLRDTFARALPYWECEIFPALADCRNILVVAHGNSLRGIVKHLRDISDTDIAALEIPTATPWVFEFDDNLVPIRDYSL